MLGGGEGLGVVCSTGTASSLPRFLSWRVGCVCVCVSQTPPAGLSPDLRQTCPGHSGPSASTPSTPLPDPIAPPQIPRLPRRGPTGAQRPMHRLHVRLADGVRAHRFVEAGAVLHLRLRRSGALRHDGGRAMRRRAVPRLSPEMQHRLLVLEHLQRQFEPRQLRNRLCPGSGPDCDRAHATTSGVACTDGEGVLLHPQRHEARAQVRVVPVQGPQEA